MAAPPGENRPRFYDKTVDPRNFRPSPPQLPANPRICRRHVRSRPWQNPPALGCDGGGIRPSQLIFACASARICAHFPSKFIVYLSKNPVNLSYFIVFFRYYYLHLSGSAPRRAASPFQRSALAPPPEKRRPQDRFSISTHRPENPPPQMRDRSRPMRGQPRPRREDSLEWGC